MATAKQLAARKRFTAIMKSGGFPVKRAAKKKAATKKRRKNPAPALPAGMNPRRTLNAAPKRAAKKTVPVRRKNPVSRAPSSYAVHLANSYNEPGRMLATFVTKPLAVEYANGYANKHRVPVCIVGKK